MSGCRYFPLFLSFRLCSSSPPLLLSCDLCCGCASFVVFSARIAQLTHTKLISPNNQNSRKAERGICFLMRLHVRNTHVCLSPHPPCVFTSTDFLVERERFIPLTSMATARMKPGTSAVCAGFPEETDQTLSRFPVRDLASTGPESAS